MASDIHSVLVGETWRKAGMVAKASGSAITSGTVNYYLKALTGANAGKWWKNSDQTWDAAETDNAMTHQADGSWTINLAATPFADAILYLEYAKESGDLHVAGEGRLLRGKAVLDSVSLGAILGTALTETSAGYLAAAFKKLFDVATPLLVASDAMRGTDGANTVVPDAAGTGAAVVAALEAYGDAAWSTADVSALALESSITALAAAVGTPLQASAYTAPANATVTAIHDLVKAAGAGDVAAILAAAARVAALVEDSGGDRFTAKALEAAPGGVGSDPLLAEVPGSYAAGSAGAALGLVPGIKAKTDLLGVAGVTVVSPTASGGQLLTIVRGDDYLAADGRAPAWSSDDWPDLTAAAVQLTARDKTSGDVALSAAGEVTVAGAGDQTVRVELPTAATSVLRVGAQRYVFDVEATLAGGSVVTLVMGTVNVLEDQTR